MANYNTKTIMAAIVIWDIAPSVSQRIRTGEFLYWMEAWSLELCVAKRLGPAYKATKMAERDTSS